MTVQLYVATDAHGVERVGDAEVAWNLPTSDDSPAKPTTAERLELRDASALLDALRERIFLAALSSGEVPSPDPSGIVAASEARLLSETTWDVEVAATFALDCAEHVLDDAADAVLPGGASLGTVITEARAVVARSSDEAEERLGTLARLAAARRLRKQGDVLGDVAFGTLQIDLDAALDALDDPAWATVATVRDAVLGAVEAVRHLALPRYVAAREHAYEDGTDGGGEPPTPSGMIVTPWGTITLGAEHQPGHVPAWVAARDTALRARDAAQARSGGDAAATERAWQAARLTQLLASGRA
jgi:hypothetical protein